MTQKYIDKMIGYKATNANLQCQGFQFEIGKWYAHEGELDLCKSGFHFCSQPSGPRNYCTALDTRIFKVEAEQVLDLPITAGTEHKMVAQRIRLVEEILATGHSNTGHSNTGDNNTGHSNTGHSNTGDSNTGDSNTGDSNTGHSNTGHSNTGYSNTGHNNTGDSNTGDNNTGYNNTGHSNTGDSNTGHANATNNSTGFFCIKEPTVLSFDEPTELTQSQFMNKYPNYWALSKALISNDPIDIEPYKDIPGITVEKLKALHDKMIVARSSQ